MNKSLRSIIGLIGLVIFAAEAEPIAIYRLAPASGSFQQIQLTQDIYRFSDDPELHNLQVVDADQSPIPYRILPAEPETRIPQNIPLAFFPVAADTSPEALRQVYAHVQLEGAKVELSSNTAPTDRAPGFYLIDISKLEQPLTGLQLNWEPHPQNQYLEVHLEASHDLQQWNSLGTATLVNLGGQGPVRNRFSTSLQPHVYEFLRLRILRGAEQLQISSIEGEPPFEHTLIAEEHWLVSANPKGQVTSVDSPQSTRKVMAWEFIREETTPATKLKISIGDNTYADEYALYSRTSEQHSWQLQRRGIWYSLRVGSIWETSDAIILPANSQKFWRLELNANSTGLKPQLEFRWQPLRLQVVTNDKPPFYLVINPEADNKYRDQVFNQILAGRNPSWTSTPLEDLHQQPLTSTKPTTTNWRTWLFWGALIGAVFVLLGFALRLLRQLNRQLSKSPADDL